MSWYKDAVIYQLHVRSFFDSNGDGIGDFPGLTQKLDYVSSLGVTAVWLLPFYPSPLKDEGYDIADYTAINPAYGTLDDFQQFLDEAHARGLKVITELVINHTSDQHPWFQRARRAALGSRERNYYVWSDTTDRYRDVRIIFRDFEVSNWSWDHVAGQYFWHRFYSHQPDLNFDSPDVRDEVIRIADFWLDRGVDGLRLDAVPYLFEREDTNCESLPETHQYLRTLRKHVDEKYPDRMLLAEANQWADETAAYFGQNDECHMCFHFPLMPRLFLALQQENRFPVIDILRQTPEPPESGQWAIFLRNHDELTLEMVSEEDRLFMYRTYASDPQSRINVGVRRRLAPLLKNDRRKLELLHGLLLSLRGTPVLYYGDEILMGDNFYLRDRDAVRTPMQWSPDRNAGFSTANPQRLFLPPVIDPEYHFQTNNVETQDASPHSLLWWLRRIIHLRGQSPAFGRGTLEFLTPSNPRILAFLRRCEDEVLLIVVNLSRLSQFVELNLAEFRGRRPHELFGGTRFPMIGDLSYLLTLGPHGFYWFRLEWPQGSEQRLQPSELPSVTLREDWSEILHASGRARLEQFLPEYLSRQAWFPGAADRLRGLRIADVIHLQSLDQSTDFLTLIVQVDLFDGQTESWQLPMVIADPDRAAAIMSDRPSVGLARLRVTVDNREFFLCDATAEPDFWMALLHLHQHAATSTGGRRVVIRDVASDWCANLEVTAVNSLVRDHDSDAASAVIDEHCFVSLFRRVEDGLHPEEEIGRLAATCDGLAVPRLLGTIRCVPSSGILPGMMLGLMHEFLPHEQTMQELFLSAARRLLDELCGSATDQALEHASAPVLSSDGEAVLQQLLDHAAITGERLSEMHRVLTQSDLPDDFAPEPVTVHYRRSVYESLRSALEQAGEQMRTLVGDATTDSEIMSLSLVVAGHLSDLHAAAEALLHLPLNLLRIRCHGSLTLNALVWTGTDIRFLYWGGQRRLPLAERRLKRIALRDLGQLVLSLRELALSRTAGLHGTPYEKIAPGLIQRGLKLAEARLISGYRRSAPHLSLIPEDNEAFDALLKAFMTLTATRRFMTAMQTGNDTDRLLALQLLRTLIDTSSTD